MFAIVVNLLAIADDKKIRNNNNNCQLFFYIWKCFKYFRKIFFTTLDSKIIIKYSWTPVEVFIHCTGGIAYSRLNYKIIMLKHRFLNNPVFRCLNTIGIKENLFGCNKLSCHSLAAMFNGFIKSCFIIMWFFINPFRLYNSY